jgi:hypothetical protein
MVNLVPVLCVLVGLAGARIDSRILFAGDTTVSRSVQEFAWRVIETHCNYQRYELEQRSFWAYDAQARRVDGGVVYSIHPFRTDMEEDRAPAIIQMTLVDDGRIRLAALKSSFVPAKPARLGDFL